MTTIKLVPLNYYTVILFDEEAQLVAAVQHDDYTSYTALNPGVTGSDLSDNNVSGVTREELKEELGRYLNLMWDDYDQVYSNHPTACSRLLTELGLREKFQVVNMSPPLRHVYSIEAVRTLATTHYTDYAAE